MKKTIGFITLLFMSMMFVSCEDEITTVDYQYSDYSYYQVKTFDDQLDFQDGTFYVYYYSEGCPSCQSIKNDVLGIIAYLDVDTLLLFDVYQNTVGLEPSFNLANTPSLVKVTNHTFDELYVGVDEILPILESLE